MPRAGPSRSQPSQYHSQRPRGRRADPEDSDDNDNDTHNADSDIDMDLDATQKRTDGDDDVSLIHLWWCTPRLGVSCPPAPRQKSA